MNRLNRAIGLASQPPCLVYSYYIAQLGLLNEDRRVHSQALPAKLFSDNDFRG